MKNNTLSRNPNPSRRIPSRKYSNEHFMLLQEWEDAVLHGEHEEARRIAKELRKFRRPDLMRIAT